MTNEEALNCPDLLLSTDPRVLCQNSIEQRPNDAAEKRGWEFSTTLQIALLPSLSPVRLIRYAELESQKKSMYVGAWQGAPKASVRRTIRVGDGRKVSHCDG